ncbi:MAG: tetratricopeptide repeat protein [Endomicrobiales bacterium]|nr:tetratricopeptide repeat protein [Endomicrobiales bacterium]
MRKTFDYLIYFTLFVTPIVFFTDLTRNPYYFQIVLVNALTVFIWALWLLWGMKKKTINVIGTPLDVPLFALVVVATVSWGMALFENRGSEFIIYSVYSEGLKRWLYLVVNAALVYYLAVHFVDDDNRSGFIHAVFLASFVASVYGILQYFGMEIIWPKILNPFGSGRCVSTFGNPNFLSSYLVLIIPVMYVYFVNARSAIASGMYLVFMLACYAALLCTFTRSSWLGLFVAMVVLVFLLFVKMRDEILGKWKKCLLIPAAAAIIIFVFWPRSTIGAGNPSVLDRLVESSSTKGVKYYGSYDQRRLIWSCAWHMVRENPFFGKGWGCFELFYPFYQGKHLFLEDYISFRTHANNAHNEVMEIWSQLGTVGLGVYIWLFAALFLTSLRLFRDLNEEKKALAMALFASLCGMMTDNMLNVSVHFAIPGFLYWWHMGMLVGLAAGDRKSIKVDTTFKKALVILLVILGALAIKRYYCNFRGEINYFTGFKLSKKNILQGAIPALEKAHRCQRFEVNNNYELANCYARAGERKKALAMYKEALRANAGYDEIYFNMATVLAQTGRTADSIPEYTRALNINPLSLEAYGALGSLFLQDTDRYAGAGVKLFEQCVHFFPENKDIWNNLGFLYTKAGMEEDAVKAYKKAFEINPDFELAKKNLMLVLAKQGKRDRQIEEYDAFMARTEKAIIDKDWQRAFAAAKRLVELGPNSFKAHLYLANINFTLGKIEDAVSQYLEALRIEPNNVSATNNLALAYFELRQYDRARQCFVRVLELSPDNESAKQKLAEIDSIRSRR